MNFEKLCSMGLTRGGYSTPIRPVTVSGYYECADGFFRLLRWESGQLLQSSCGYSATYLDARRSVEEKHGLCGPDNEAEFTRALGEKLGIES